MSRDDGHNPMRWDCQVQGCFNRKKRPKIEMFADCLPGRTAFSDVDAVAEICGNLLFLEWKDHQKLSVGQRILFERITAMCPATVFIIEGNAEHMTVDSIRLAWQGEISPCESADLEGVRNAFRKWSAWALANPAAHRSQEASWN